MATASITKLLEVNNPASGSSPQSFNIVATKIAGTRKLQHNLDKLTHAWAWVVIWLMAPSHDTARNLIRRPTTSETFREYRFTYTTLRPRKHSPSQVSSKPTILPVELRGGVAPRGIQESTTQNILRRGEKRLTKGAATVPTFGTWRLVPTGTRHAWFPVVRRVLGVAPWRRPVTVTLRRAVGVRASLTKHYQARISWPIGRLRRETSGGLNPETR